MQKVMVFENGNFRAAKATDNLDGVKSFIPLLKTEDSDGEVLLSGSENHCVTTNKAITLKLDPAPNFGDTLSIVDAAGSFSTNNITIKPNGNKLNGSYQDFVLNDSNAIYSFKYSNGSFGWKVVKRKLDYDILKVQNDTDLSSLQAINGNIALTLFDYQFNTYQTNQWIKSTLNQRLQQRSFSNEYLNLTLNLPTESYYTLVVNGSTTGNLYIRVGATSIDSGTNYQIAVHDGGRTHTSTRYNSYAYFPLSDKVGYNFHNLLLNATHYSNPKHLLSIGNILNGSDVYTSQRCCIWNNTVNRIERVQLYNSATSGRFTGTVELWRH